MTEEFGPSPKSGGRIRRPASLIGLGIARVRGRLTGVEPQRVILAILSVAFAIGLLVTITGLSMGLASGATVRSPSVDYWIVPESGGASSIAVSTSGPKLGDTHRTAEELAADNRIRYATPVLIQVLPVENTRTGASERVLAIGVVPPPESMEIAGLETQALTVGDPYYNAGGFNGRWTGEVVLSDAAATFLEAGEGDSIRAGLGTQRREFEVKAVSAPAAGEGLSQVPIMLVHLSELQAVTGGTADDVADQILVSTDAAGVATSLEGVYPGTIVVSKSGLASRSLLDSGLPLAVALVGSITALGIGALFVATMMGLEVAADRRNLAVLSAVGFSARSRALVIAAETVTVAGLGGILGVLLGIAGIYALNAGLAASMGVGGVAVFDPWLALYGLGVALLVGLLATPYPLLRARNTNPLEVLSRAPG